MKQANVYLQNQLAGVLTEDENGFTFNYDRVFLQSEKAYLFFVGQYERKI